MIGSHVRLGLCFDARNPPPFARPWSTVYARVLELVQHAEEEAIDMVWLSEHHQFEDGYLPQPLTMAAAIGARTQRIGIGTAVSVAPLRHPRHLAEEAAVVDLISDGRLELGLGPGYRRAEFTAFGVGYEDRFSRTVSIAEEVQSLWGSDLMPRPVQARLPLWFGFNGPQGAATAGRLGAGLITTELRLLEIHRQSLAEHFPAATPRVAAMMRLFLADDPPAAWQRLASHVLWQWDSYRRAAMEGTGRIPRPLASQEVAAIGEAALAPGAIDAIARHGLSGLKFAVCTAEQAARLINALGPEVTDVLTFGWLAGAPDDLTDRHLQLFAQLGAGTTDDEIRTSRGTLHADVGRKSGK